MRSPHPSRSGKGLLDGSAAQVLVFHEDAGEGVVAVVRKCAGEHYGVIEGVRG